MSDPVDHPPHYNQYEIEVIWLTEVFDFCIGNAIKYVLRAPAKGNEEQDVKKAIWYLNRYAASVHNHNLDLSMVQKRRISHFLNRCFYQIEPYQKEFLVGIHNETKCGGLVGILERAMSAESTKSKDMVK